MSSLLAVKHWKGQFKRIAGINPDYSYGRNNMAAFIALLKRFNIEHEVVTEQWPKVGIDGAHQQRRSAARRPSPT